MWPHIVTLFKTLRKSPPSPLLRELGKRLRQAQYYHLVPNIWLSELSADIDILKFSYLLEVLRCSECLFAWYSVLPGVLANN
jgi:hypothetical protein